MSGDREHDARTNSLQMQYMFQLGVELCGFNVDPSSESDGDDGENAPIIRQPRHTSWQTCFMWVNEILEGHEGRSLDMFRMKPANFFALRDVLSNCAGFQHTRNITKMEMLAIFLYLHCAAG